VPFASLTEKGEELITKVSDYILKLTIDFSQEFTKNQQKKKPPGVSTGGHILTNNSL
jgi:hypothetical protein